MLGAAGLGAWGFLTVGLPTLGLLNLALLVCVLQMRGLGLVRLGSRQAVRSFEDRALVVLAPTAASLPGEAVATSGDAVLCSTGTGTGSWDAASIWIWDSSSWIAWGLLRVLEGPFGFFG